jgi:hypothetical protein
MSVEKPAILAVLQQYMNDVDENDAQTFDKAHDLFTWLPLVHKVKRFHGDYYSEHIPNAADAMGEACDLIAYLLGYDSPDVEDAMNLDSPFLCPCGEYHVPGEDPDNDDWSEFDKEWALRTFEQYRKVHQFAKDKS